MGDVKQCDREKDKKCPRDGRYQFNTAVAFNGQGDLVARYHKLQLWFEQYYNPAPEPEYSYFDTEFGRVGLEICFDLMWKEPGIALVEQYNITTLAFTTWWFDEAPFLYSTQYQSVSLIFDFMIICKSFGKI